MDRTLLFTKNNSKISMIMEFLVSLLLIPFLLFITDYAILEKSIFELDSPFHPSIPLSARVWIALLLFLIPASILLSLILLRDFILKGSIKTFYYYNLDQSSIEIIDMKNQKEVNSEIYPIASDSIIKISQTILFEEPSIYELIILQGVKEEFRYKTIEYDEIVSFRKTLGQNGFQKDQFQYYQKDIRDNTFVEKSIEELGVN